MSRAPAQKRKPEAPAAPVEPEDQLPEKRPRVEHPEDRKTPDAIKDVVLAGSSSSTTALALLENGSKSLLAEVLGSSAMGDEQPPTPVDVLLRPVDFKVVPIRAYRRVQEIWLRTILYSIKGDPRYFANVSKNGGLNTASMALTLKDHPSGPSIPYKIGTITRGGPSIRTPLLMGSFSAKITPTAGRAAKDRFKDDKKKEGSDSNTYFMETPVLRGNSWAAKAQADFLKFMEEDVARFFLILACKEKDTAMPSKDKVLKELLKSTTPDDECRGEFSDLDAVPRDHPKLKELADQWLRNKRMLIMNKDMFGGAVNANAMTFKAKADIGWGNEKKEWAARLKISHCEVGRNCQIIEVFHTDDATIEELMNTSPYTITFSFKVNYDKTAKVPQLSLEIDQIQFYPQLKDIVEPLLNAKVESADALSEEDARAMDAIVTGYMAAKGLPLAITHAPAMRVNTDALRG